MRMQGTDVHFCHFVRARVCVCVWVGGCLAAEQTLLI